MPTFTTDVAGALGGPAWLAERRVAAAERADAMALPSPDEEVWRYSRVAELDLDGYHLPTGADEAVGRPVADVQAVLDLVADRAATVVLHEGRPVLVEVDPALADAGLVVAAASTLPDDPGVLGGVLDEPADVFDALNAGFAIDPVIIDVPRGMVLPGPIVVVGWVDLEHTIAFPSLSIRLGEGAEASVLDWHGGADVDAVVVPVVELDAGQGASLRYAQVQDRSARTWQLGHQVARVGRDATVSVTQAALGGTYARSRTDCRLVGRGAHGDLAAIYAGDGDQTLDFRTFQVHEAPDTTSNLLFKGALDDTSRSVYTGTIRIEKEARRANAFQTNRNLKLSDGAWAESVPNLEIENNDVHCSHASTVGPIDEDQRFYLESRGVPTPVAERLVVAGFFDEVLTRLPVSGAADAVRGEIAGWLTRRDEP